MTEKIPQTYANHMKFVPLYHYVTAPILLLNMIWAFYRVAIIASFDTLLNAVVALALGFLFFFARKFALEAQDRVIRLEEHLRMLALLPDDLKTRINDFTINQTIALRFASDEELPELSRKILDDGIKDSKTIKEMIKTWKPDYQRL